MLRGRWRCIYVGSVRGYIDVRVIITVEDSVLPVCGGLRGGRGGGHRILSWVSQNFYKVLIGFDQSKPLVQPKVEGRTPEHHGSCCFLL